MSKTIETVIERMEKLPLSSRNKDREYSCSVDQVNVSVSVRSLDGSIVRTILLSVADTLKKKIVVRENDHVLERTIEEGGVTTHKKFIKLHPTKRSVLFFPFLIAFLLMAGLAYILPHFGIAAAALFPAIFAFGFDKQEVLSEVAVN